jgi:hypothetical protein
MKITRLARKTSQTPIGTQMDNPIHAPELDEQSLINLGNRTIPQSRGSNGQSKLALLVGLPITRHRARDSQPCTQKPNA